MFSFNIFVSYAKKVKCKYCLFCSGGLHSAWFVILWLWMSKEILDNVQVWHLCIQITWTKISIQLQLYGLGLTDDVYLTNKVHACI